MEISDEQLIAYLDGELSDRERLKLEQLLHQNTDLQLRLNAFREVDR